MRWSPSKMGSMNNKYNITDLTEAQMDSVLTALTHIWEWSKRQEMDAKANEYDTIHWIVSTQMQKQYDAYEWQESLNRKVAN